MQKTDLFTANKELNESEMKAGKLILQSKPRMLMVVLTTRCNVECVMCSRSKLLGPDKTFAFDTIKQVKQLFPYLEAIDWQGGEVFLVDYFKDLFLEASAYPNIDQSIITNGLLINKEWAEIFANSRVNLTFSIDAVTKHKYESIRKGASFERLIESLEIINEMNKECGNSIQLHINAVVMRSNYKELHLFPDFCQRYGIKHLRFDFLRPDVTPEEDILINQDIDAIKHLRIELDGIEKGCKDRGIWFEYTFRPFLTDAQTENRDTKEESSIVRQEQNSLQPKLKCKLPWKKIFIDAAAGGIVRPDCLCCENAGNIMETPIEDIWNNSVMQAYRKNIIKGTIENWCSETCLNNAVDTYQLEGYHQ